MRQSVGTKTIQLKHVPTFLIAVYRPNRKVDLPSLIQTQVIASRDPRLSPSLPNSSIYSRDFDIDDDGYGFDDDGSGSFNSEDWYMNDEVSCDFEEAAKTFKVKVHVNPKFIGREEEEKLNIKPEQTSPRTSQEGAAKEKVKSWLKDSVDERTKERPPSRERSSGRRREESPAKYQKERIKDQIAEGPVKRRETQRSPREPQKSIQMFPDERSQKRSISPMFTGSLFPHIQPLKTKDFGKKWEGKDSPKARPEPSGTPQSPVRDRYESKRPQSPPPREYIDRKVPSPMREIPCEAKSRPRSRTPKHYSKPRSISPYSSASRPRSPVAQFLQRGSARSPVRSPTPPPQITTRILSPEPVRHPSPHPQPISSPDASAPDASASQRRPEEYPIDFVPDSFPPSEQWTNRAPLSEPLAHCCLRPLSGYAKRSSDCLIKRPSILDRLVDSHRRDVFMELDHVCQGRKYSKYDQAWKHLPQLSMETQLESTFAESAMVKRVYLATLREWMTTKPLDNLLARPRGTENEEKPLPIRSSLKTDSTLKQCMEQFEAEIYHLSKGGKEIPHHQENVYPKPINATEETVDEVYRQVHQYMDFLNKKAINEVNEKPKVDLLSPLQKRIIPAVEPVPSPVQAPSVTTNSQYKTEQRYKSPKVPEALAYSPSRPTGQDEEEEDDNESEISKKRKGDSRSSPAKKHKSEDKKNKKKDKKHKKDKKKEKLKKAKKKRKERKMMYDYEDEEEEHMETREDPKSADSDSSDSETPHSTRRYSETIESPTKEEFRKFGERKFTESKENRWNTDRQEDRQDKYNNGRDDDRKEEKQDQRYREDKYDDRREERFHDRHDDRYDDKRRDERYDDKYDRHDDKYDDKHKEGKYGDKEDRYEDRHDGNRYGDKDRKDDDGSDRDRYEDRDRREDDRYDRDRHDGGRSFRGRGYRQSDAFLVRKWERERKGKCRNTMQHVVEHMLAMLPQEETVLETTIATWKMLKDITHTEATFVTKHLVESAKHLSRDFDAEKGFNWALILAIHSQVMQDAQDRIALEEASAAAAKAEQELEEGELEESPAHDTSKDEDTQSKPEEKSTKSKPSKSGLGNKLLNAFRQQMAAKKREEQGIVNKVEITKLSKAAAAKKPKPSSSRPLFKPPAAFEMLKAAQEERDRQKRNRRSTADSKEELRFDGVVREGLVADALKSFFHLTEDVLQLSNEVLAADFIEYVLPVAFGCSQCPSSSIWDWLLQL